MLFLLLPPPWICWRITGRIYRELFLQLRAETAAKVSQPMFAMPFEVSDMQPTKDLAPISRDDLCRLALRTERRRRRFDQVADTLSPRGFSRAGFCRGEIGLPKVRLQARCARATLLGFVAASRVSFLRTSAISRFDHRTSGLR